VSNLLMSHARSETPMNSTVPVVHHGSGNTHALQSLTRLWTVRRKWLIGSIVICEFLALIIVLMMKPTYGATSTIELNKGGAGALDLGVGDDALAQQLTSGADTLKTDLQTEISILQGDSLALAVIQHLRLASQPPFAAEGGGALKLVSERGLPLEEAPQTRTRLLKIFGSHLTVQPIRGTRLIQVTYESHDPKQAAQVANALIESYKNQYLQSHYDATTEASNWLTKQLSDLKANVEDSEKKLTDFEKETGILSFQTSSGDNSKGGGGEEIHSVVIEKLDALNAELTAAEANRIEKEAIYRLARTGNADVVLGLGNDPLAAQSNSMVLTQGGGLSNLQQLQQQQSQLKINLTGAATTYGANNRHLKEMQTQMRALDEQIQEELQQIIKRAQVDFQLTQQTEGEIRRQFDQQQAAASKLNEKMVQFAVLSQEAFSRKKLYEDLYTKLQEANVSAGIKATNITIVDPARSQSDPVRPKPVGYMAIGLLFGIFVGLSTAFTADNLDRTVTTPLEVEEITGKPVIGVIPTFGEPVRTYGAQLLTDSRKAATKRLPISNSVWMLSDPNSGAAEACRALRTSIMLSRTGGGPRIILVTSCIPGEGKTTLTMDLAVAFAQHNKKVIVIEADMRRPRIKHVVDVPSKAGLSNVLAGSLTSDEAILHGVHVAMLDVLPAGPRPPMPSEILGSAAFDELLEELRLQYDIVLIDSPPALLVTDAVAMSAKTDAVLWVAQAGVITRPQLARAAELIERNRIPVIGFVVNRMDSRSAGYGYEYYGRYYGEKNQYENA
jgi:succinoglycan biosynthesis transport protein ExoP